MATPSSTARTKEITFDDVVIRFTRQIYYDNEDAFQLEIRQAPGPLPGGAFQANVEAQLEQFRQIFNQYVTQNQFFYRYKIPATEFSPGQDLADLGHQLYELLPESFRQAFPRILQDVFGKGRGLRLIIEARAGDKADRLLSLPWELLFFKKTQVYLARTPQVLIIRRLLDAVRRSPVRPELPLNVTHVIAHTPTAPKEYWIDESLQQVEREAIRQVIVPGYYRLVASPGSVEQMLTALREQSYYIVHFLGHGEMFEADGTDASMVYARRGYLRFIGADGSTQWVTGEQLQHLLSFTPTVQLVVLNACHGGASAAANIALELVYSGLPNVVAIQSDILQDAAKYFIEAFYPELQRGQPIEYALAVARATIAANMPQVIDWCLPVLYTNTGLSAQPLSVRTANSLWQWAGHPAAKQWAGIVNMILGTLHLTVGLLLFLSGASPPLPNASSLNLITVALVLVPLLLMVVTYLGGQLTLPNRWSFSSRAALILNSFISASIGLGLASFYSWLLLTLLASLGFWGLLSPLAQLVLLCLIFTPGIVLSYSQIVGQGRAFITNAQVKLPAFEWSGLVVVIGGYAILLIPWLGLRFGYSLFAPPQGNFIMGALLLGLGYLLYINKD